MHKNNNEAVGYYGIYQILVHDKVYKIGKADIDRIIKKTHDPVRIHQQIRKLIAKYGDENVYYKLLRILFGYTTAAAKAAEQEILALIINQTGFIPEGNSKNHEKRKENKR